MNPRIRHRRSFVLLEVTLAIVILAVVMTALLRGFLLSMNSINKLRITSVAIELAESLMEDYELEPPMTGRADGRFADDVRFGEEFAAYKWRREVREVDSDYRDVPRRTLRDPEPLYHLRLSIVYEERDGREFVPVAVETYLLSSELFSTDAMQFNQLF